MGKIIAVWSDIKKSGKSVVSYMLANQIKELAKEDSKILVCCLNLKYSALYKLFGVNVSSTGIEDLVNYQFFETSKADVLTEIVPQSQGIYFLGSYRTSNSFVQKNTENFDKLLEELQRSFDIIIFDTVSGRENVLTNLVLQRANVILELFVQDNDSIKELSKVEDEQPPYNQEVIYMVSKYRNIYPRISDIKRRFELKKIYAMDFCDTLQEMKNRDSLHLYLQRETNCNDSIRHVSKYMLEILGLLPQKDILKEKPRRYISSLYRWRKTV